MKAAGVCQKCQGKYWRYEVPETGEVPVPVPCVCLQGKRWAEFLGSDIFSAKAVASELYNPVTDPDTKEITGDRTEDNLFIKGPWSVVRCHFKFTLYSKKKQWPSFDYLRATDKDLLDVWFGRAAFSNKPKEYRESKATYNSLGEFVSPPALLMVDLGVMQTPNKLAPKILLETLSIRDQLNKPTWLIENLQSFGLGHPFYSSGVHNFIQDNFDLVSLSAEAKEPTSPSKDDLHDFSTSISETDSVQLNTEEAFSTATFKPKPSKPWQKKKGGPQGYF